LILFHFPSNFLNIYYYPCSDRYSDPILTKTLTGAGLVLHFDPSIFGHDYGSCASCHCTPCVRHPTAAGREFHQRPLSGLFHIVEVTMDHSRSESSRMNRKSSFQSTNNVGCSINIGYISGTFESKPCKQSMRRAQAVPWATPIRFPPSFTQDQRPDSA